MLKPETVDRALEAIKGYAQYEYFFDCLNSPAWLKPLAERGFFKHPQEVERVDQYIRFPFCPELRYLARMSKVPDAQAEVLAIARGIPFSDNSRIYDDLAEIALSLPPAFAAQLVPKLVEGVRLPIKLLLKDRIGTLILYLAEGGQGVAAKTLVQAALALAPDPSAKDRQEETLRFPKAQPLFEDFYYRRIIDKAVPALAKALGMEAVQIFADLLDEAIKLSQKRAKDEDNGEDYLYIGHPAIELGNGRDHIPGILLYAVRDAAEQFVTSNPAQLSSVLDIFKPKRWTSFQRLRLHLCRVFLETGGLDIAEETFQEPEILNRASLQHEAVLLLKESFSRWSAPVKERLLQWMDTGWSGDAIRRWLEFTGQPVIQDSIQKIGAIWKRDHYAILQGQLPELYQRKLDELIAKIGPARLLAEPGGVTGGAFEAVSPKAPEEFSTMSVAEIVEFLATWTPGTNIFDATAEGAGRELGAAVVAKLDGFVAAAGEFKRLDPTYVRAFFAALSGALKQRLVFDWKPVLSLAAWVASRPREIVGRSGGLMVADPDWGWSRDAIIDLISAGFDKKLDGRLTLDLRPLVWSALRPLTEDPNPSPAVEARDPQNSGSPVVRRFAGSDEPAREADLATLSINTTRGRAMHAVFNYAKWLRLCTDAQQIGRDKPGIGLDTMPEVREVLEAHLDVRQEPTKTIRSVYGDHLTLLAWLDWNWLEPNLGRILPLADAEYAFFKAAWSSFVVFNTPNTTLLRALPACYSKAIHHLGNDVIPRHSVRSPEEALAEHLMVYYWLAALEFGGRDQLLDDFYALAADNIRGHAIWFIGTSVPGWDDKPPLEVFVRLQNLFSRRLEAARNAVSPDAFRSELSNFGHWFTSERFDEHWSIETLLASLQLSKRTSPEMDVVKRLSDICQRYPTECVSCLSLIIEGDREGWILVGVEEDARAILRQALDSNHPEGSLSAKRLIEQLLAKGQFGFRTLLT